MTNLLLPIAGTVTTQLAIPNLSVLVAVTLQNQVLQIELDPSQNITAIVSTNGVTQTIGSSQGEAARQVAVFVLRMLLLVARRPQHSWAELMRRVFHRCVALLVVCASRDRSWETVSPRFDPEHRAHATIRTMTHKRTGCPTMHRILVVLTASSLTLAPASAQAVYQVGPGGYATIAAALQVAPHDSVIRLAPGVHLGTWNVQDKSIRFVADGPGVTVVASDSSCHLRPTDRVEFSGVNFAQIGIVGVFSVVGGLSMFENCAFSGASMLAELTALHMRHCTSTNATIFLRNSHATISSSAFTGGPAVHLNSGSVQVASSTIQGTSGFPAAQAVIAPLGMWLVDCQVTGGNSLFAAGQPAIGGTFTGTVRVHRSLLIGGTGPQGQSPAVPGTVTLVAGPLLGAESQPPVVTIGSAIQLRFRGEPGDAIFVLGGFELGGGSMLPGVEQPGFGLGDAIVLGLFVGDPAGAVSTAVAVPNDAAFHNLCIVFRGIDVAHSPLQLSPVVPVVVR